MSLFTPFITPNRFVIPARPALAAAGAAPSGTIDRIVKYVPAEIVSIYTLIVQTAATIKADAAQLRSVVIWLFIIFFVGTAVYEWRFAPRDVRVVHAIVSPLAFAAWAYAISGSLVPDLFVPVYSLAATAVVLLLSVIVVPK
jgi:hypothetical protein